MAIYHLRRSRRFATARPGTTARVGAGTVLSGGSTPISIRWIEIAATPLVAQRPHDSPSSVIARQLGVLQVTVRPDGRSIRIAYDPTATDVDALVGQVQTAGYGLSSVTLRVDWLATPTPVCRGTVTAAVRHTRGVLDACTDGIPGSVLVCYLPGPTTAARLTQHIRLLVLRSSRLPTRRWSHRAARRTHGRPWP